MSKCVREFVVEYNHADTLRINEILKSTLTDLVRESLARDHGWSLEDLEGMEVHHPGFDEARITGGAKVNVSIQVKPSKRLTTPGEADA